MKAWVDGSVVRMLWLYITTPRISTSEVSTLLRNLKVELGGMCVGLTNGLSIRRHGGMDTWVPLSRDGEDACSYLAPTKMAVRSISPLEAMDNVNRALRRTPKNLTCSCNRSLDDWYHRNSSRKQATPSPLLSIRGRYGCCGDLQRALFPSYTYGKARNISAHRISDQTQV